MSRERSEGTEVEKEGSAEVVAVDKVWQKCGLEKNQFHSLPNVKTLTNLSSGTELSPPEVTGAHQIDIPAV